MEKFNLGRHFGLTATVGVEERSTALKTPRMFKMRDHIISTFEVLISVFMLLIERI